jgi:hypothetical protein
MGCTKAIAHRELETVDEKMPPEFWQWLNGDVTL